jgi:hypothetical protein
VARNRGIAIAVVVALAVVALTAYLIGRGGDGAASSTTTTQAVVVTSPYDLTEADPDVDLDAVRDAKFASILLDTGGGVTSYMVASEQPAFEALAKAVAGADETDEPIAATGSTLAFVMPDRVTVTFDIDTGAGLIGREDRSWRPDGDLAALIAAVTEQATATTND